MDAKLLGFREGKDRRYLKTNIFEHHLEQTRDGGGERERERMQKIA